MLAALALVKGLTDVVAAEHITVDGIPLSCFAEAAWRRLEVGCLEGIFDKTLATVHRLSYAHGTVYGVLPEEEISLVPSHE